MQFIQIYEYVLPLMTGTARCSLQNQILESSCILWTELLTVQVIYYAVSVVTMAMSSLHVLKTLMTLRRKHS